ncbi:SixA phosphatase family protein [Nocardioides plantarum]|uniref:Histidine phosphatase family protein n=1 Tax=Nocardioides plantarum TaxID=29299 RepID=A0ABV5K8J5_9ACTN|nr:histidine phosphatase family protein [Nocardioides plantarum]
MVDRTRTLVVMRHAKAEPAGPSDAERALAPQGHGDAEAAGRWLRDRGLGPDAALVSAARRTRETWERVAGAAGWALEPTLDEGLYAADAETALDLVRLLDDEVGTALVIGHNPTVHSLVSSLDDGEGDADAGHEMLLGLFPTSATAVLTFTGSWGDLAVGRASLVGYHVGRQDGLPEGR